MIYASKFSFDGKTSVLAAKRKSKNTVMIGNNEKE
jgi:hypothetical protein